MADSPGSSDLSDPPSVDSDNEDQLSTAVPSSRPSVDITYTEAEGSLAPPSKRRKTGPTSLTNLNLNRAPSSQPEPEDDNISLSSDGWSSAPGSPNDDEYSLREQAQTLCLWRDCDFGSAVNNDDLVNHVQMTHCATGGPKKSKYLCEWGECQKKSSSHPSGYALKAHMRSHTKEKPYYCSLPECDKAFTRSDALAKHMRTVHEPEPAKGVPGPSNDSTPSSKKSLKIKLTNGSGAKPPPNPQEMGPTHDEDGNEIDPSPTNDNITYIPAHHPITGQPGFMIHYPPDIHFTAWESSITADQLMRLLRRQVHWAQREGDDLKKEMEDMERQRKDEWTLKEILVEGLMEADLAQAEKDKLLRNVEDRVKEAMRRDVEPAKKLEWTGGEPAWRRAKPMQDDGEDMDVDTPGLRRGVDSPSPPPTGASGGGGFDGDADPYDNYLATRMAEYEERERLRSMQNTPAKAVNEQQAAEADAVGALMGLKGQ